ncbi:Pentapeptide repeat-containing protein [Streptosporangium canum]|uniref:Pentapeptide repeat-containing protein n=1 Tax=Streptosporangium canum TaxID=324952 RepID=A0A1I3ND33_9ACTN|nr:pentapeptide repeat-containing protein [Streptosporangium canum]SFJ06840.1 Pentapeptide repeat-containing protein [Streptosporangium canum]
MPQRFRELDRPDRRVRDGLTDELMRLLAADHGRFLLLLGDFGHGKTFALRELARRMPVELPPLVPILIELRALDKAHSVDGLVAAHLANHGEDVIDLKAFHADLSGADLTRARLARADLRDVALAGSRWQRAALIDVTGTVTGVPELRGAAIAPGRPVEAQLTPAAIGVPYGYHFHTGRLPEPVAYSPDGRHVAAGGDDPAVRLWDARTGRHLHALTGHTRRIWSLAFAPAGDLLAGAGDDGVAILWNLRPGTAPAQRAALLGLPEGWAAIAPDGRYKLVGEAAGQFWYVIGTRRFKPGELDAHLPAIGQIALDAEF